MSISLFKTCHLKSHVSQFCPKYLWRTSTFTKSELWKKFLNSLSFFPCISVWKIGAEGTQGCLLRPYSCLLFVQSLSQQVEQSYYCSPAQPTSFSSASSLVLWLFVFLYCLFVFFQVFWKGKEEAVTMLQEAITSVVEFHSYLQSRTGKCLHFSLHTYNLFKSEHFISSSSGVKQHKSMYDLKCRWTHPDIPVWNHDSGTKTCLCFLYAFSRCQSQRLPSDAEPRAHDNHPPGLRCLLRVRGASRDGKSQTFPPQHRHDNLQCFHGSVECLHSVWGKTKRYLFALFYYRCDVSAKTCWCGVFVFFVFCFFYT